MRRPSPLATTVSLALLGATALVTAGTALAGPQPAEDRTSAEPCTLAEVREPGSEPGTIDMRVYGCETHQVSVDVPWALDPYCRVVPLHSFAMFPNLPGDARDAYVC